MRRQFPDLENLMFVKSLYDGHSNSRITANQVNSTIASIYLPIRGLMITAFG